MADRVKVGVLISGRGSNMTALVAATRNPACPYEIVVVASDKPDALGLSFARDNGILAFALSPKGIGKPAYEAEIDRALRDAGVQVDVHKDGIRVSSDGKLKPLTLSTAPFPAFPTDMQAQFMAMLTMADGASVLTETIFENRYMHVPELARMGADIAVNGRTAVVRGVDRLVGAPVMATDLRASMSLILAGLAAEGETQVNRVYHLDRGYERLEEKLSAVGADIERASDG